MIEKRPVSPTLESRSYCRGRVIHSLSAILVFFSLLQPAAAALPGANGPDRSVPVPSREEVSRAIALAAGYLERACGPTGKFVYQVDTCRCRMMACKARQTIIAQAGRALAIIPISAPTRTVSTSRLTNLTSLRQVSAPARSMSFPNRA